MSSLKSLQSNHNIDPSNLLKIYEYIYEQADISLKEVKKQSNLIIGLQGREIEDYELNKEITVLNEHKKRMNHYLKLGEVVLSGIKDF